MRARWRRRRRLTGFSFVAGLAALAGMTDAIGFLSIGHFVSFMSGNTTQLALALGGGDFRTALLLAGVLLAYVAGNAFGIVIIWMAGRRQFVLLGLIAALLAFAALLPGPERSALAVLSAVLAMGLVNAAVERVEGHPFGITYVTGALSRFGRGLGRWMVGDRSGAGWALELVPFVGMLGGAVLGALFGIAHGRSAILLAAGLSALLAAASLAIPRSWRRRYHAPVARAR
ncbi:hypothetical protein ASG54_18890 [Aureimonas sp. Leaf460]|nr:hypothetical protein ASG62_12270 [Aureimonas sp. Leaf427]KQT71768.1 hypothetical protein ASG54_18890 [Aureimonas sp. Leaf460]